MKVIPIALASHYALGSHTLAYGLKITRSDAAVYAFTSFDRDVTLSGVVHLSGPGLNISEIVTSAGLAVDNLELATLDDGTTFSARDVLSGVWRNAAFQICRFNYLAPADGVEVLLTGTIGNVRREQGHIIAELRGLQQYLQQPLGSVTSKTCRARLGDDLCTVALGPFTATGSISGVTSNQLFQSTGLAGGAPGDPNYASVGLLLHCDGTNGSTSFPDNSPTPKTVTAVGNAQVSTATTLVAGQAALFDGSGDYLSIPYSADFDFPGDFRIDFAVRFAGYSASYSGSYGAAILSRFVNSGVDRGWMVRINGTASTYDSINIYTGITDLNITGLSFALNTLYQVEISRVSGVIRAFVNGVQVGSSIANTDTFTRSSSSALFVGGVNDATFQFHLNGRLDEIRIDKATASGHTATFTPNTIPFYDDLPDPVAYPLDWFTEGIFTFTSGANNGLQQKVKSYLADGTIGLSLPMLSTVAIGNTFSIVAGCRKRKAEDCRDKFDNVLNFQGESELPGINQLTSPP